jgi:hypothetical protein
MVPATAALAALSFVACQDGVLAPDEADGPLLKKSSPQVGSQTDAALVAMLDGINVQLADQGADYRARTAEWIAAPGSDEVGRTVFFSHVGNKQMVEHFVPGDPRRGGGTDITYTVGQFFGASTLPLATTTAAIDRAMGTWQAMNCSTIPLTRLPDLPGLFGAALGLPFSGADIFHAGWLPPFFLPPPILGITITFIFIDPSQLPNIVFTDIDNNGKLDTAFREIYYADFWVWFDDGVSDIDVETVAFHEAGHGLSQAHFGKLFRTDKNGKFHFAPRAVMNAGYTGPQRSPLGTDNGGHCSIWGSWPNN